MPSPSSAVCGTEAPCRKIHHTITFIQPTHAQGAPHADRLGKEIPHHPCCRRRGTRCRIFRCRRPGYCQKPYQGMSSHSPKSNPSTWRKHHAEQAHHHHHQPAGLEVIPAHPPTALSYLLLEKTPCATTTHFASTLPCPSTPPAPLALFADSAHPRTAQSLSSLHSRRNHHGPPVRLSG